MTDITYERALRQGAQRMAALLASELPETGAPPSPEFTPRMEPVVQQGARAARPPPLPVSHAFRRTKRGA